MTAENAIRTAGFLRWGALCFLYPAAAAYNGAGFTETLVAAAAGGLTGSGLAGVGGKIALKLASTLTPVAGSSASALGLSTLGIATAGSTLGNGLGQVLNNLFGNRNGFSLKELGTSAAVGFVGGLLPALVAATKIPLGLSFSAASLPSVVAFNPLTLGENVFLLAQGLLLSYPTEQLIDAASAVYGGSECS